MRRFPVAEVPDPGDRVTLDPEATHHLLHVLRAAPGTEVEVFDGTGRAAVATLVEVVQGVPWLEVREPARRARPPYPLHLLVGLPKGNAMDDAVRMATEAGATDLHPVLAARSVARGDRRERWARIATSAAQQCGRGDVPEVHPVRALSEAIAGLPDDLDRRVALPGAPRRPPATGPAAVLVGPEGGLSAAEIAAARQAGFEPMGLGRWILRTPTAVAVAVALTSPWSSS